MTEDVETLGEIAERAFPLANGIPPSAEPIPEGETPEDVAERLAVQARHRRLRFDRQRPAGFADARVSDLDLDVQAIMFDWLAGPSRTLVISGPVGVGKSHAGWALASHVVDGGDEAAGWTVPDLLLAIAPDGDSRALRATQSVPMLLLDDLGAEKPSEWRVEQLTALVDHRLREGRRQIVTTNADYPTLVARYGDRAMSRLTGGCGIVRLSGPDRRRVMF